MSDSPSVDGTFSFMVLLCLRLVVDPFAATDPFSLGTRERDEWERDLPGGGGTVLLGNASAIFSSFVRNERRRYLR